jgi:glycosyltransferase involved in cell wall biosynthesis
MSHPRVTIGVPVWNGAQHLEECLESLLAQTYEHIEILISDNASTDQTAEICRAYCVRDERVRYYRQRYNIGVAANHNFLVRQARGELFKWAAHDDVCAPEFLERCVAALDASPSDVLAFSHTTFVDSTGSVQRKHDTPMCWQNDATAYGRLRDLLLGDLVLGDHRATLLHKCLPQFGVIRRSALERTRMVGSYSPSDVVLLVELALLGGFAFVDEYLFYCRVQEFLGTSWWLHTGMSWTNRTSADLARWFDPKHGDNVPMPWTRVLVGIVGAIGRSPLSLHQKARSLSLVGRWLLAHRRWRIIGGELKLRTRQSSQMATSAREPIVETHGTEVPA